MHVKHLADMSPGALVQRAAVFLCWGLDVTGRSPLLPQQTEGPQHEPDVPQATPVVDSARPHSRGERPARAGVDATARQ